MTLSGPTHRAQLILSALDTPHGIVLTVTGDEPNARSLAISALSATKRELLPDHPTLLNLTIRPLSGSSNEIALLYQPDDLDEG